jgi:simple sugar transport system ATP-binding protein
MLFPPCAVWENVSLGLDDQPFFLDKGRVIEKVGDIQKRYGINVDPMAPIWQLSIGEQQRVAIIKNLYRSADILILDEPTSVLTPQETRALFRTIRQIKAEGHGVIFISHKLDEVMDISDRITVLRKGRKVASVNVKDVTKESLAEMMVGGRWSSRSAKPSESRQGGA